jgi:hypothetical protein
MPVVDLRSTEQLNAWPYTAIERAKVLRDGP